MKRCPQCRRAYYDETLSYCLDDGVALVYGPSDSDPSATAVLDLPTSEAPTRIQTSEDLKKETVTKPNLKLILAAGLVVVIGIAGVVAYRYISNGSRGVSLLAGSAASEPQIKSLAVLPLKPLDASDNYIGMGIADAIIRRMSQTGQLIVRPTSSIRKYLNDDTDALTAAKQLSTDAVLEGSVQRAGDQLRVSVNLLRTSDGASLWNDSLDVKLDDLFAVQDTVSKQVASRLSLRLDPTQQVGLTKRYTSNTTAFEYYQKAMYIMDSRLDANKENYLDAVGNLKKAIDADPNYALAHAQLANVYAVLATFGDPTNPQWAPLSRQENDKAVEIDPQLAEIHLAKQLLLWSSYGGFQQKAAIREIRQAQQLNPDVGHVETAGLYSHVGLWDLSAKELERAQEIDPTSDFIKGMIITQHWLMGDYDGWLAESHRLYPAATDHPEDELWYLIGKRRLDDAQKKIDDLQKRNVDNAQIRSYRAILFALKGNSQAAESEIPGILEKQPIQDPNYHHATFNIACIFALEGKTQEAVKWLRKSAETGYPCYPRFQSDPFFDRIRQEPAFVQFMAEQKADFDTYKAEFDQQ
jgi:TolB-like protein